MLFGASRDLAPLGEDPIDILVRCSLGHSHLVDRDRRVVSTRLSAAEENFCLRPTLTSEKRSFAKEVAEKVSRGMTVEQFHRFSKDPYSDESLDLLSSVAQARITPETTVAFDYVIAALMAEPPTNADKEFRPKSHVDQDLALYEKYKTSAKLIGHFIDWVDSQDNRIWDPAYTPSQIYNDAILAIFDSVDFVQIGKTISQDQIRIAKCAVARFIADRHRTINSAFVLLGGETGAEPEYLCDPKAVSNTLGIPIESPSPILAQLTPLDFVFVLDASDYARLAPSGFEFPYVTLNFGDENLSLSNRVAITCDEIAPKNANGNIDFKTLQRTFLYNRFVFDTAMEESDNALSSLIDFYSDPQSHSTEEHITAHKRAINGFAEHSLAEIREKIFCGL